MINDVTKIKGKIVTQVITFIDGYKVTFEGVITEKTKQGKMTHLELEDGRMVLINDKNVLCVEVIK